MRRKRRRQSKLAEEFLVEVPLEQIGVEVMGCGKELIAQPNIGTCIDGPGGAVVSMFMRVDVAEGVRPEGVEILGYARVW